jgi:catechol 2,3-dioxygenase-like lactoylglutathione lyase family enzyme
MTQFEQVTPFLHVPDLQKALDFFTDILGFTVLFRQDGYAYIHRETVGFRLLEAEEDRAAAGRRRFAYYIDVRDVDALYAELKAKLDTLPPGDVHGPADKPYGQRELLVLAPDGELIVFGMEVRPAEVAKA